jgi:uncharacterized protein (DUF1800 family)
MNLALISPNCHDGFIRWKAGSWLGSVSLLSCRSTTENFMALSPQDAKRAVLAMHRFGLGAKPGGLSAEVAKDPRGAVRRETFDPTIVFVDDGVLPTTQVALAKHFEELRIERLARESSRDDAREMLVARNRMGTADGGRHQPAPSGGMDMNAAPKPKPAEPAPSPKPQIEQIIYRDEAVARLRKAEDPAIGFAERLVLFWSNHFCVSVQKGQIARATAGAMEREAIRPHVLGKFADMLLAVEKHPAMLFYLDNRQSIGPNSRAGRNRTAGLNENLGREILELHTLGVDGGYSQADVTALAKIITGWTFVGAGERLGPAGTFFFAANRHEPGDQIVLGKTYPDTGVEQGEKALRDIARHPATARHIARKLARHFVSNEAPPLALIERLTKVFQETDGDLAEVSRALVNHDDAWTGDLVKIRTPYEWLAGIVRFAGAPKEFGQVIQPLNLMGAPLWAPPGPNGYPDTFAHWGSPESLRVRLDLASNIARRLGDRFNPSDLADTLFDSALSTETAQAVRRAESRQQGLAILLMSPEFQRR